MLRHWLAGDYSDWWLVMLLVAWSKGSVCFGLNMCVHQSLLVRFQLQVYTDTELSWLSASLPACPLYSRQQNLGLEGKGTWGISFFFSHTFTTSMVRLEMNQPWISLFGDLWNSLAAECSFICLGRRRSRRLTLCNFTLRRQMLLVSLPRPHTDRRVHGEHRRRVNFRAISQGTYASPRCIGADFPPAVPLISYKISPTSSPLAPTRKPLLQNLLFIVSRYRLSF